MNQQNGMSVSGQATHKCIDAQTLVSVLVEGRSWPEVYQKKESTRKQRINIQCIIGTGELPISVSMPKYKSVLAEWASCSEVY